MEFDSPSLTYKNKNIKKGEFPTMARKPMITRTITTTRVQALALNLDTHENETITVILPRTYKDDKALEKALKEAKVPAGLKPVLVLSSEVVETLYGMTEEDFIAAAEVLPVRGVKSKDAEVAE